MAADPAREGVGCAGVARRARRMRLEPDPALHLQPGIDAGGAPSLSPMGIRMAAHAIVKFGADEQKDSFLPRIVTGEVFFCQGYSEPEAGSDLAARRWAPAMTVIIWSARAARSGRRTPGKRTGCSRWCAPPGPTRSSGITFVLIEMSSPDIEVGPLVMTSGEGRAAVACGGAAG